MRGRGKKNSQRKSQISFEERTLGLVDFFFINLFIVFIYFWLRWVFRCGALAFSSCGERGLLFVVARGLLIAVASLVMEHGL